MVKTITLAFVLGAFLLMSSAQATTIASFLDPSNTATDYTLTLVPGTDDAFTAVSTGYVFLSGAVGIPNGTAIPATLTITGDTSTASGTVSGTSGLLQTGYQDGLFVITALSPDTSYNESISCGGTLENGILCGTFGGNGALNSGISGQAYGSSATFSSSNGPSNTTEVTFYSPYYSFVSVSTDTDLSISLSGLSTPLVLTGESSSNPTSSTGLVESFTASGTATFASDLTGTPEPGTLALLGSALVGLGLFGRKRIRR